MFGSILFFYLFPLFGSGPVWDIGIKWVAKGCENQFVLLKKFLFVENFENTSIDSTGLRVSLLILKFCFIYSFISFIYKMVKRLEHFDYSLKVFNKIIKLSKKWLNL